MRLLYSLSLIVLLFSSCGEAKYSQGQRIYAAICANCHMDDGSGLKDLIPSLNNSAYIKQDKYKIITLIHNGINADSLGKAEKFMPSQKKMSDVEMTNLLNYLQEKFNEGSFEYRLDDIKTYRPK